MARKKGTSKADAVRAAIAEGLDAPEEGTAFIKEKFGLDVSKPQFSSYKSQQKARAKKAGGQATPKRRGVGNPKVTPTGNGPAGLAIQVEAIKTLVQDLGVEQVVSIARLFGK